MRAALLALATVLAVCLTAGCGDGRPHRRVTTATTAALRHFLASYVTADGRVLRHGQGEDIASESEAYGMLAAELAGQPGTMRTIWSWSRTHLQRPDGLLSWHADGGGTVLDREAASDADVLVGYALLRSTGPDTAALRAEGRRVANAVLARETVLLPNGRLVLTAGPWALGTPATVNPSYWMPTVFRAIAKLTGDGRWSRMAATSVRLLSSATDGGRRLPPDWARLTGDTVTASAPPTGGAGPRYGSDAQRVPVWFAREPGYASALAAGWWPLLREADRSGAHTLTLDGQPDGDASGALPLLAAAASAQAAGDEGAASALRTHARQRARAQPTYYGDAWVALSAAIDEDAL